MTELRREGKIEERKKGVKSDRRGIDAGVLFRGIHRICTAANSGGRF